MKQPAWWRRYRAWRLRHVRRLVLEADGFAILEPAGAKHVRWNAIRQVSAFKRDLLTVDMLCLAIATTAEIVEINEEMSGYSAIELALCTRLGIGIDWKMHVLFPAFAPNATLLFNAGATA